MFTIGLIESVPGRSILHYCYLRFVQFLRNCGKIAWRWIQRKANPLLSRLSRTKDVAFSEDTCQRSLKNGASKFFLEMVHQVCCTILNWKGFKFKLTEFKLWTKLAVVEVMLYCVSVLVYPSSKTTSCILIVISHI